MVSRLSWSLLIAMGMVGSGAGIALTQAGHDASLPHEAASTMSASASQDINAWPRSDVVNDQFTKGGVLAQAAGQQPFAVFRATPSRH